MRRQTGEAQYLPMTAADKTGGLIASHAILAALFQRERDGVGQHVEVPMFEAMTSFVLTEHLHARIASRQRTRLPDIRAPSPSGAGRLVGTLVAVRSTAYWLEQAAELDIPAAPVNRLEDLETDPHLQQVDFFTEVADEGHTYRFTRNPVRMRHGDIPPTMPPKLGADTEEVLRSAGVSSENRRLMGTSGAV